MSTLPHSFSAAVRQHLLAICNEFNRDLGERYLAAAPTIETQANVRTDIGTPKTRKLPSGKTLHYRVDGARVFKDIRYPHNAMRAPDWETDPGCRFSFGDYVQAIGSTGFSQQGSLWWGYDLDDVWGHADGLSDAELERIQRAVEPIPYTEIRRSTSGKGIHLYIRGDGIVVANHTEHAALARSILGMLCSDAGLDFAPQVDSVGNVLWIWDRRATSENRGFELLKPATKILTPADLPPNWRDHLDVVRGKRSRVWTGGDDNECAELASKVAMDDEHRRLFEAYKQTGFVLIYNPDLCLWQCHTAGWAKVHKALGLRGFFETNSDGTDPGTPNCYVFLRPDGMLLIVRFNSQQEHSSWGRTAKGERSCLFNRPVDLRVACEAVGAIWVGNGCTAPTVAKATQLAALFGFELPPLPNDRAVNFKYLDAHTIAAETTQLRGEVANGWGLGWRKLVVTFAVEPQPVAEHNYDTKARHVITPERENAGWLLHAEGGGAWHFEPKDTAIDGVCYKFGIPSKERAAVAGQIASNPYTLVNEPFQAEFLPGRKWNKFGAQLSVVASDRSDHPHYDKILRHVGQGLDDAVKGNEWCRANGVTSGYDFLLLWCALLIRKPKQHLPMLYLYSPERDNGKSAFHKALGRLFARGYVEGVRMLNEKFNKLMAGAVLIYLDEEKVSRESAQKVKLYIDSDQVTLRLMRTDTFMFANYSHWIATYNFTDGVPVEDGDERVIMIEVPVLFEEDKDDWKEIMEPALELEKADFLNTLQNKVTIPPSGGRLYLPLLSTPLKEKVMAEDRVGEKVICNRDELLAKIVDVFKKTRRFIGPSKKLIELLGPGSWDGSRNHIRQYVREIEAKLLERGITLDLSHKRLIILEGAK